MSKKEALTIVLDLAVQTAFDNEEEAHQDEELYKQMIQLQEAICMVYDIKEGEK